MEDVIVKAQSITEKFSVSPKVIERQQIQVEANNPDGFSFSLIFDGSECTLVFGDWHESFDNQEEALFAFEKCLSGEAQLRVATIFNIPCMGTLEILSVNTQKSQIQYNMVSILYLILLLFPKREKVYRNSYSRLDGSIYFRLK